MRHSRAGATTIGVVLVAAVCCVAVGERQVYAQGRAYSVARRIEAMERQADEYERDELHRKAEEKTVSSADRKRTKAIAAQVIEDFDRIQVIYNDIVRTISSGKKLDETLVSESVAGINKCAGRLKVNLALPQLKDKEKSQERLNGIAQEQLTASLTTLLNHISSFVTNPLFESGRALDIELSTRASRDLNEIIELSNRLRKATVKATQSQ